MPRGVFVDVVSYADGHAPLMDADGNVIETGPQRYNWTALSFIAGSLLSALLYSSWIMKRLLPYVRHLIRARPNLSLLQRGEMAEGSFMRSILEEACFTLSLSAHHLTAASLMLAGQKLGIPLLWLAGMIVELGYEIADTYAMARDDWPYAGFKAKWMRVVPLMHHIPTMLLVPLFVRLGYHRLGEVQTLGWSLVGAGGVGFLAEGLRKLLSSEENLAGWLVVHTLSAAIVFWLRMIVYPQAASATLHTMHQDQNISRYLYDLTSIGLGSGMAFNIIVMVSYVWNLGQHLFHVIKRSSATVVSGEGAGGTTPRHVTIKLKKRKGT